MRSDDRQPDAVFSYVSMESRIPQDHPLRAMRTLNMLGKSANGTCARGPPTADWTSGLVDEA
jgi:hypothetical protein